MGSIVKKSAGRKGKKSISGHRAFRSAAVKSEIPKRLHFTIPSETEAAFAWYIRYDERFHGEPSEVLAHFFRAGMQADYDKALSEIAPQEPEVQEWVDRTQKEALAGRIAEIEVE